MHVREEEAQFSISAQKVHLPGNLPRLMDPSSPDEHRAVQLPHCNISQVQTPSMQPRATVEMPLGVPASPILGQRGSGPSASLDLEFLIYKEQIIKLAWSTSLLPEGISFFLSFF